MSRTLFAKIWDRHTVMTRPDGATLLHVARHMVHDGSRAGFVRLREQGLKLRHPERTFGTPDHYVSTASHDLAAIDEPFRREMVEALTANAAEQGFTLFDLGDARQGIIHVVGPEQGVTQPGLLMVCGDSHTATHGALGALAFGIGSSEVSHVLATQTLWQSRPRAMRVTGALARVRHARAWAEKRDEARERGAARRRILERRRLAGRAPTALDVLRPGEMEEY